MNVTYLTGVKKQFKYYKSLGDQTFSQLNDDQLFWQADGNSNSIAIIVKHLWGNMLSRWTDFLTTDGEKKWRKRDEEFESDLKDKKELVEKWEEAWACLFNAIEPLTDDDLHTEIFIRNQGHTVLEAFNRQLAHYPYHIGQIVFIAKLLTKENWQSLSIPKGKSGAFNQKKFAKEKHRQHYTDEFTKDK